MSDSDEDKSQKTEEPTQHRLEKAKEDGQFPVSKEASHAMMLLAFTACIFLIFPNNFQKLITLLRSFLQQTLSQTGHVQNLGTLCQSLVGELGIIFIVPALLLFSMAFIAGLSQTHFQVRLKSLEIKLDKLSIAKGLGRIFSMKALMDFFKSLIKFIIITTVTVWVITPYALHTINYPGLEVVQQLNVFNMLFLKLMASILVLILTLGIADFFYEKWMHLRKLRMSKQEIKDEHKNLDGDPKIKGRIRQIRMERAKKRMMEEVPKATVLITNPTHFAIALKYDMGALGAPIVLAKGVDYLALKMREIAKEHNIPIIDNPPLARALHKDVKEGKEIPLQYYESVANIIRYIYNLKNNRK